MVILKCHVDALCFTNFYNKIFLLNIRFISMQIIISKDIDFVELMTRLGPPPQIVRLTCGNLTTPALIAVLEHSWHEVERLLREGAPLVELG